MEIENWVITQLWLHLTVSVVLDFIDNPDTSLMINYNTKSVDVVILQYIIINVNGTCKIINFLEASITSICFWSSFNI